ALLGTRLLSGGFLCLLLPVAAALAAAPLHPRRQIAARVVLVLTIVTLLVTPTRSSWIGAMVGMLLFGVLSMRHLTDGVKYLREHRHRTVYPVVALGAALVLLLTMSDISGRVSERAHTVREASQGHDDSFQWRWSHWKAALLVTARRPLFGLGLGNYVLRQ